MGRTGLRAWVSAAAALVAVGCGYAGRPHAHDPLVRDGRAVWGDRDQARLVTTPQLEPLPPPAPVDPGPLAVADE